MFQKQSRAVARRGRPGTVAWGAALMCALTLASPLSAQSSPQSPEEVVKDFLRAFVAGDYQQSRSYLADGAHVLIVRRQQGGEYESTFLNASQWLDQVGASVHMLEDFRIEFFDASTLLSGHGVTVVLKARSTARTPRGAFTNNEQSATFLIRVDRVWRILQYSMFEDFNWRPNEDENGDAG